MQQVHDAALQGIMLPTAGPAPVRPFPAAPSPSSAAAVALGLQREQLQAQTQANAAAAGLRFGAMPAISGLAQGLVTPQSFFPPAAGIGLVGNTGLCLEEQAPAETRADLGID